MIPPAAPPVLSTTAGDFPLGECRLAVGGREWSVLYTATAVSLADEARFLADQADRMPYGVALWPAAIALAHEVATRADEFRGKSVLELGAGTGLPGIVAGSIFTFSLTLGDYIIPQLVGPSKPTIGLAIYQFQGVAGNLPLAAAYTAIPIIIMAIYLTITRKMGAFEAL